MKKLPKRLAPKGETLRRLFLLSGNLCAYPGCSQIMMDPDGDFIGQICHIEAATDGERFNEDMSDEDRRQYSNLMLMCYEHHTKTNDVEVYTVEKMKEMKAAHERRFERVDRAMLAKLTDWTTLDSATFPTSLASLNIALNWSNSDEELQKTLDDLNSYVKKLNDVPIDVRHFVGEVAKRVYKMRGTGAVTMSQRGVRIKCTDLESALNLSRDVLVALIDQLDGYGIGDLDQISTDFGEQPALRLIPLHTSNWNLWPDLAEFCHLRKIGIERFSEELDFAVLDDSDSAQNVSVTEGDR